MSYLCGCYYRIYSHDYYLRFQKHYLPLLDSEAHSTILSTTSRTVLRQTFTNPSTVDVIKECIYTFPLYDGVSVVSFTCRIGKKVLKGLVKEKFKAKQIFDDAVAKGETAGLLEQAPESSDVFSTKLGNIPAGESVEVEITYIGELKHHETEGIRFTIPTSIAPRYGSGPNTTTQSNVQLKDDQGIRITVDVNMPEGSFIKGVQSPSHPIAVSMGTVSTATKADPTMSKASATLSLGNAALEKDFVLIVQAKDIGIPKAILEIHPTIPNHRALMATLVPKFSLPPSRPEIVFVADRSGSMGGNIQMLVSAMKVFLKSIPVGVKFNICSFGSNHSFLWPKSKAYTAETLAEATTHLSTFNSNMGGTETYGAIKATVDRRFADLPLEIMLLTDGDIWNQNQLFEYVNKQVESTKGNIRIFPLGIGSGVSHALIEGLARAGNGFTSAVQDGERLDNSVVRMLRGALSPHITDYTLEVKYEQKDDDFEIIEKVTEGMKVLLSDDEKPAKPKPAKPTISLFDTNVDPEKDSVKGNESPYAHLPNIPFPKILQAPHKIPSLFAFSRASVYLLLSPETIQRNPTSVVLRATSNHGPLALEIPVETLPAPAQTIHQLAAKKAVQDLEEGRGWIYDAKDQKGKFIKQRYPSCFDELVQKEAVRLGEKFQIAGKWCSFVAVAANDKEVAAMQRKRDAEVSLDQSDFVDAEFELASEESGDVLRDFDFDDFIQDGSVDQEREVNRPEPKIAKRGRVSRGGSGAGASYAPPSYSPASPGYSPVSPTLQLQPTGFQAPPAPAYSSAAMPQRPSRPASFGASPVTLPIQSGYNSTGGGPVESGNSLQQHQMSLMMLEQQNKKRLMMSRAPQDSHSQSYSPFGSQPAGAPQSVFGQRSQITSQSIPGGSAFGPGPSTDIRKVIERGESLDMSANSDRLAEQSKAFYSKSKKGGPSNPFTGVMASVGGLFGSAKPSQPAPPQAIGGSGFAHQGPPATESCDSGLYSMPLPSSAAHPPPPPPAAPRMRLASKSARKSSIGARQEKESEASAPTPVNWTTKSPTEKMLALISLQDFEGSWPETDEISAILGFQITQNPKGGDQKIWVTLLVVKCFEEKMADEEGTWGLVVEKARGWLEACGVMDLEDLEVEAGKVILRECVGLAWIV